MQDFASLASLLRNNKLPELQSYFEERRGPVDDKESGSCNSLLHIACQNGSKRGVKCLLRNGADINAQNNAGNTPLHYCFRYDFRELGEYLLEKGADDSVLNKDGQTCYEQLPAFGLS